MQDPKNGRIASREHLKKMIADSEKNGVRCDHLYRLVRELDAKTKRTWPTSSQEKADQD